MTNTLPPLQTLRDKYLYLADLDLKLISVFDELKYDRSDADILSVGMRRHVVKALGKLGFKQVSGLVLEHKENDMRCLMPKFHALGGSPFDITRYTAKRVQDFYILTPTQTACQFIDAYPTVDAVERIKALIEKQPINIKRLWDYLDRSDHHRAFEGAIGHLKYVQREAISKEPLKTMRALG